SERNGRTVSGGTATARAQARTQTRSRNRPAPGGSAGDPASSAAPAGAHDLSAAGNSRAHRRASGGAHAGSDHPPKFKRASGLEIADRGGDRAQQALS